MHTQSSTSGSVAALMRPVVATVTRDARFKEVARLFADHRVEAVPVVSEEGRILGVVTASDMLVRLTGVRIASWDNNRLAQWASIHRKVHADTAGGLMSAPAITVAPSASAMEAGRLAARTRVHVLPVVNDVRVPVGMLTRQDLVRLYLRPDSDIRVDVMAALDRDHQPVDVRVDDGVVTLRGAVADALTAREFVERTRLVPGVVDVHNLLVHLHDLAG